jgi:putative Mn2+ efflux pump MntP
MSDISIRFDWWEWLLISPVLGWPGAIAGAALGAALSPKRRIAGGVIGAIIGNLIVFAARLMLK